MNLDLEDALTKHFDENGFPSGTISDGSASTRMARSLQRLGQNVKLPKRILFNDSQERVDSRGRSKAETSDEDSSAADSDSARTSDSDIVSTPGRNRRSSVAKDSKHDTLPIDVRAQPGRASLGSDDGPDQGDPESSRSDGDSEYSAESDSDSDSGPEVFSSKLPLATAHRLDSTGEITARSDPTQIEEEDTDDSESADESESDDSSSDSSSGSDSDSGSSSDSDSDN